MTDFVTHYGLWGLLLTSCLAATLIPVSSEAALAAALGYGFPVMQALAFAIVGNCLACLLNYGLGYYLRRGTQDRMQRSRFGRKALQWSECWGTPALLLSWLPLIGDPLTVAAGVGRVPLARFVVLVFSLRIARYLAIAGFFTG